MTTPATQVEALIVNLTAREGGYVDHPADRGGPTKWGITQATLSAYRGSPVSAFQVQSLTATEAAEIYRQRYFYQPGFDAVADPELQELLVDYGVNSGPEAAVKSLQLCLQRMKLYTGPIDGDIGPLTRQALRAVNNVPELYYRVKCERWELFLRYIGRDPSQAGFATGWSNRMDMLEDSP